VCCLPQFLPSTSMTKKYRLRRYFLYCLISLLLISSTTWAATCYSPTLTTQDLSVFSPTSFGCHSQADSKIHGIQCVHDNQEARLLRRKVTLPDPNAFTIFSPRFALVPTDCFTTNTCFTDSIQPILGQIFLRNSIFRI